MTHNDINRCIYSAIKKNNIVSYPINCFDILKCYGYNTKKYSDLSKKKYNACMVLSEDACLLDDTIYYNQDKLEQRIRFSLMHELGHVLTNSDKESDANYFSSNFLAPRILIHYSNCKNCNDVARIFGISSEAAMIAFDEYRKWRRCTIHKMSTIDKLTYYHFYNKEQELFVWNKSICNGCGSTVYNSIDCVCDKCNHISNQVKANEIISIFRTVYHESTLDNNFKRAERNWLYGDCY